MSAGDSAKNIHHKFTDLTKARAHNFMSEVIERENTKR